GAWARAADCASSAQLARGMHVRINEGTVNAGAVLWLTSGDPIVLGTTAISFSSGPLTLAGPLNINPPIASLGRGMQVAQTGPGPGFGTVAGPLNFNHISVLDQGANVSITSGVDGFGLINNQVFGVRIDYTGLYGGAPNGVIRTALGVAALANSDCSEIT